MKTVGILLVVASLCQAAGCVKIEDQTAESASDLDSQPVIARRSQVRKFSALAGRSYGSGTFPTQAGVPTGHWQAVASGDILDVPIVVNEADRIIEVKVRVFGDTGCTLRGTLFKQGSMTSIAGARSQDSLSAASNSDQTVLINLNTLDQPLAEDVDASAAAYFVRVRASGAPAGSGPFVGVVTVTTTSDVI